MTKPNLDIRQSGFALLQSAIGLETRAAYLICNLLFKKGPNIYMFIFI